MRETHYDETIVMDDAEHIGSTFTKCDFEYSGGWAVFRGCAFDACTLRLRGPAANTLHIIAMWAQGYLDSGHSYERTWDLLFAVTRPEDPGEGP